MRSAPWFCGPFLIAVASACGSESVGSGSETGAVSIEPPITCEPGPEITVTQGACEFTSEGSEGPTAVQVWTIENDDGSTWGRFAHASDGSLYLFSWPALGVPMLVERLGPDLEPEWSRRLAYLDGDGESTEAKLYRYAIGDDGVHVVTVLHDHIPLHAGWEPSWLQALDANGTCADPVQLAFAGEVRANVGALLREADSVVLVGKIWGSRGFIQRRDLAGGILDEAEIVHESSASVQPTDMLPLASGGYFVPYSGSLDGLGELFYQAVKVLDASFTEQASFGFGGPTSWGHYRDAFGQIYSVTRDGWDPQVEEPPVEALELTLLATEDEPASVRTLAIPQPQCGFPTLAIFDENLAIINCPGVDLPTRILGYVGSGEPSWTIELDCLPGSLTAWDAVFREDGRLWLRANVEYLPALLVVEFD